MFCPSDQPEPGPASGDVPADYATDRPATRLNLLLSYGGWREGSAVDQLPHLLSPLGIQSIRVHSGEEAAEIIKSTSIHIAVVDLAIPLHRRREEKAPEAPSGARVLQL